MAAPATPQTTMQTVTNLSQASRIAWRWAITFTRSEVPPPPTGSPNSSTTPRSKPQRSLPGTLSVPAMWISNLSMISAHPRQIVHIDSAAMRVPNPRRHGRRRLLLEGVLVPAVTVVVLAVALSLPASSEPPVKFAGYVIWAALLAVMLGTATTVVQQFLQGRGAGSLTHRRRQLGQQHPGATIVVGSMFGAWPRNGGAGSRLFTDIRAELARDRVTMIVTARDPGIANWYVNQQHGHQHDPTGHPLHIEWVNP